MFNLIDIKKRLNDFQIIGNEMLIEIVNARPIENADEGSLVWIKSSREDAIEVICNTPAKLILCDDKLIIPEAILQTKCFILVDNPKLEYLRLITKLFVKEHDDWSIHATAIIDPQAEIADKVYIGPYCTIGKAKIGNNTVLKGYCVVGDNVSIGNHVNIHQHTLIGSDGFGFVRNKSKKLEKFYHLGNVVIEDYVDIYPFVNVDKGALGETRIKAGTKVDHYCHIGHNSTIGEDSIITAGTVFCGGASVGARTWIGVNSIIKEKTKVWDDVVLGLGSVVTKDVPEGETWLGSPAREIKEFISIQKEIKKLINNE